MRITNAITYVGTFGRIIVDTWIRTFFVCKTSKIKITLTLRATITFTTHKSTYAMQLENIDWLAAAQEKWFAIKFTRPATSPSRRVFYATLILFIRLSLSLFPPPPSLYVTVLMLFACTSVRARQSACRPAASKGFL